MTESIDESMVEMRPYARRINEDNVQDITTPLGQWEMLRRLFCHWSSLPDNEFKLALYILGQTILFGREGAYITYRAMTHGNNFSVGLQKSPQALRKALTSLERRGAVYLDRTQANSKGLFITLNRNWSA